MAMISVIPNYPRYLFVVIALLSQVIITTSTNDVDGSNSTSYKDDIPEACAPYVFIDSKGEVYNTTDRSSFKLFIKPIKASFTSVEIEVGCYPNTTVNAIFDTDQMGMNQISKWHELRISNEIHRGRTSTTRRILLETDKHVSHVDIALITSEKFCMTLYASGSSLWKSDKPNDLCNELPASNIWQLVMILAVVMVVLIITISVLIYKIRHPKTIHLPSTSMAMENDGAQVDD